MSTSERFTGEPLIRPPKEPTTAEWRELRWIIRQTGLGNVFASCEQLLREEADQTGDPIRRLCTEDMARNMDRLLGITYQCVNQIYTPDLFFDFLRKQRGDED